MFWWKAFARQTNSFSPFVRGMLGFGIGLAIMMVVAHVLVVNRYDYDNIRRGTEALWAGQNPWASVTRVENFYNPPFSMLFLWPLFWLSPRMLIAVGGALITAVIFYRGQWLALAWFLTNMFLWLVAAGQIDMYVMGGGLLLLFISDDISSRKLQVVLRLLAYGFLLIKPQGGLFVVLLHFFWQRDWVSGFLSAILYGLVFAPLYPDWLKVLLHVPPPATAHITILGKFGWEIAIAIALAVLFSKPWTYWGLGGALAGILPSYGMVGIPVLLLLLDTINRRVAVILVVFSACLALATWRVSIPVGAEYYDYIGQFMDLYHLVMLGLTLALVIVSPSNNANKRDAVQFRRLLALNRGHLNN